MVCYVCLELVLIGTKGFTMPSTSFPFETSSFKSAMALDFNITCTDSSTYRFYMYSNKAFSLCLIWEVFRKTLYHFWWRLSLAYKTLYRFIAFEWAFLKRATSWENLLMPYANNKGADQPAHPRSLISAFVVRCLDSLIFPVSISEISSLYLASVAAQAGLCLTWSQTPKTDFLMTRLIW